MERVGQLDLLIYLSIILTCSYVVGLLSVFIVKTMVMHNISNRYDSWRSNIDKGLLDFLPIYFCEWCTFFWLGLLIILILCFVLGHWYLIITPLLSTPIALSKYK